MSKFCPIPWIFQAVRNNGDIRVCCQANVSKNQGVLRKEDNSSYNAKLDDLEESRNSELMKTIRKNIINDVWSEECGRCQQEEESGLASRRQYENELWKINPLDVYKNTALDGSIKDISLKYYDLRFGNLCNLACRMCGPTDSDKWYKEYAEYFGTDYKDTHGQVNLIQNEKGRWITENNDYDWHESENFWNQIELNLKNIQHVYMAGGEPLMIERHYDFLEKCVKNNYAKNITLEYNTNLTNVQPRVIEYWKNFKEVRIGISLDGIEEYLEYQRWPAKWKAIEKNIRIIDSLPKNIMAWFAVTVTVYNIFHIPDMMKWKIQNNFKKINSTVKRPILTTHMAHKPQKLNIKILPIDIKNKIKEKFNEELEWVKFYSNDKNLIDKNIKLNESIINYMFSEDKSNLIPEFVKYTNILDKSRKQNILDIVPEYASMFQQTKK